MSISVGEKSFSCPAAKVCHLSVEGAPPCGEELIHTADLVPPHELCVNALWNRYQAITADTSEPILGRKLTNEAELLLNLGSHPNTRNREAANYFSTAEQLLAHAKKTPQSRQPYVMNARLLSALTSTYSGYAHGLHPSGQVRYTQRQEISRIMYRVRTAPLHEGPLLGREHVNVEDHQPCLTGEPERKSLYIKLAFMQLVLKAGLDLIPTPSRTRRVCDALVWHNYSFTPISALTSLPSGNSLKPAEVVVFPFENLARKANRRPHNTVLIDQSTGDLADTSAYLLEKETGSAKVEFTPGETSLLRVMSDIVREAVKHGRFSL